MAFELYNTYSRRKEVFESLEPNLVRMYNCGPTVYGRQHVGNFRAFLFADLLRRWLEYRGYQVQQVMNITDVGHLVADADDGDDKIEKLARQEQLDPFEISRRSAQMFLEDVAALGVLEPMARPRATEYIAEMATMVQELIDKGHAYRASDGSVYFDVTTFERYGQLSGNRLEDLQAGARIAINEDKRNPADFALWKTDPKHLMKWDTALGKDGFPGWHIECSAMARALLGDRLDIHTGGEDNVFPHHECEIAQSEALTGEPFARYWLHTKFLQVDGGKMSKSLGNIYSIDDVAERGFSPRVLRFALLRGHYRQPLNFTWDQMQDAQVALDKLDVLVQDLRRRADAEEAGEAGLEAVKGSRDKFEASLDDDLNVPQALAALFELRSALLHSDFSAAAAAEGLAFLKDANRVLAVMQTEGQDLAAEVTAAIESREEARRSKNWAEADRIRDELLARGIELKDTPQGVEWITK